MKAVMLFLSVVTLTQAVLSGEKLEPRAQVMVRTYNYHVVDDGQLAATRVETARIFERAGISIEWIDCRVSVGGNGASCTEPLLPGRDLMLRLVDRAPIDHQRVVALAESILDRETRGGVLMTVDLFPVRAIASHAALPVPTLLGRAIAHEIGHLLLRSGEHPGRGLMRATWSRDELQGVKPAHWGFSSREAAQMRRTLLELSRAAD